MATPANDVANAPISRNNNGDPVVPAKEGMAAMKPEDFMKLFIEQLKHQNPMQPTDSSAILQQMSQISQISASADMQKSMKDMSKSIDATMTQSRRIESSQMVGKYVQIESKQGYLPDEADKDPKDEKPLLHGSVLSPGATNDITFYVKDVAGKVIYQKSLGGSSKMELLDFKWDGVGDDGVKRDPGLYDVTATAMIEGKPKDARIAETFKVTSVLMGPEGFKLNIDKIGVKDMNDVARIMS